MNECESLVSGCSPNADCTDTDGNYKCSCKLGFVGDGAKCARKYEIIGRGNNIPTMQFFTGISRNTQSISYVLSLTECV